VISLKTVIAEACTPASLKELHHVADVPLQKLLRTGVLYKHRLPHINEYRIGLVVDKYVVFTEVGVDHVCILDKVSS